MRGRQLSRAVVGLFLAASVWLPAAAQSQGRGSEKGKTSQPAIDPARLVWPGPPEKARVRFVAAITGEGDVRGPVKLSLVDRLAGRKPASAQSRLVKPYGVAVDRAGRVYVAEAALQAVVIFDRANKQVTQWRGNGQFPLSLPVGVAVDGQQRVFVSDARNGLVVLFNAEGTPTAGLGSKVLGRPGGLAIDAARNLLYVADPKLNQVLVFSTTTLLLERRIGTPWTGKPKRFENEMFSGVSNVAVDARGRVYITDAMNCRIQVFGPDGTFQRSLGGEGTRPGSFIRPRGVAMDSEGHVYVADAAFNNFQILTAEGQPLLFVGGPGDEIGQFTLPAGMAIDSLDRIYVTEQRLDGGRLQIFQYLTDTPGPRSGQ